MTRSRVAWTVALLDIVIFLATSLRPSDGGIGGVILYVIGIGSFAGVGALLITRVPANPIGVLLLAAGTTLVAAIAIGTYADAGLVQVPPWPGSAVARVVGDTLFVYPFFIALVLVPLVFPDGRLPSPRFRWVVRITVGYMVAWALLGMLFDRGTTARVPALEFLVPVVGIIEGFILVATLVSFGAAVLAVVIRFRRGDSVQRQQIKWLAADVAIAAVVLPLALILTDAYPALANILSTVAILTGFVLPIVIGIAVLRYRLYEIDRLISRTIGWAIVTGILVAVFAGLVVGLQAVLSPVTEENTLAVAASTLVAFALFQPLRRRVQRAVDRRFDRARYDGERVIETFSERLRDQLDLGTLPAEVANVARETVRPVTVAVWLRNVRNDNPAQVS